MKNILIAVFLLAAQPITAAVGENELELKGFISSWTQNCAGGACLLPVPGERNRPVTLRLALPTAPGEAAAAHAAEKLLLPGGGELPADLTFYAICPYGGKENCAGRYFQAQVSLSGPAGAFCASALNAADFVPFPVLMCAGSAPDGRRFGITLHRQPL
jgi:hypothetical protein